MQLRLRIKVLLLFRHLHDIAERTHSPGDDRDLLDRLGVFLDRTDQRMSHFVVRDDAPLFLVHDAVFLLLAHEDLLHCFKEILLIDILAFMLDGIDRRLIDHIGQIRAHRSARRQSDLLEIDGLVHLDVLGVYFQNSDPAL